MPNTALPTRTLSIRDLPPNIFAIVMATGIVALAVHAVGRPAGARALFGVACSAYAIIWLLAAAKLLLHPSAVRFDLATHARAPGFFTVVAATGVLGSGSVILFHAVEVGLALWILSIVLWAALSYSILPALIEAENKPELEKGLSGVWLLTVVATQSICVLGCLVIPHLPDENRTPALFTVLCFWLVGGMLYLWLIALIFYRIVFRPITAADLSPPYWINMGAMAISTLGGASLASAASESGLLTELLPFLKGLTLMFWATATWWLPLLLMLGFWRHGVKRYPLTYEHGYWGAVFPLGMYSVCTYRLSLEFQLPFLIPLADVFAWFGLLAWTATALGMIRRLLSR